MGVSPGGALHYGSAWTRASRHAVRLPPSGGRSDPPGVEDDRRGGHRDGPGAPRQGGTSLPDRPSAPGGPKEEAALSGSGESFPEAEILPAGASGNALEQMTRAFSLNLSALSLLALVVGTFLVYNTMTFPSCSVTSSWGRCGRSRVTRGEVFGADPLRSGGPRRGGDDPWASLRIPSSATSSWGWSPARWGLATSPSPSGRSRWRKSAQSGRAEGPSARSRRPWDPPTRRPPPRPGRRCAVPPSRRGSAAPPGDIGNGGRPDPAGRREYSSIPPEASSCPSADCSPSWRDMRSSRRARPRSWSGGSSRPWPRSSGRRERWRPGASRHGSAAQGVAAAALVVAVSTTVGIGWSSSTASAGRSPTGSMTPSLSGRTSTSLPGRTAGSPDATPLPPDLIEGVSSAPGSTRSHWSAITLHHLGYTELFVMRIPREAFDAFRFREGDPQTAWEAMRGGAVIVSGPVRVPARIAERGHGATAHRPGRAGVPHRGVYYDYSSDQGLVGILGETYERFWDDRDVDSIGIRLRPGPRPTPRSGGSGRSRATGRS